MRPWRWAMTISSSRPRRSASRKTFAISACCRRVVKSLRTVLIMMASFRRVKWWARSAGGRLKRGAQLEQPAEIVGIAMGVVDQAIDQVMGEGRGEDLVTAPRVDAQEVILFDGARAADDDRVALRDHFGDIPTLRNASERRK